MKVLLPAPFMPTAAITLLEELYDLISHVLEYSDGLMPGRTQKSMEIQAAPYSSMY